MSKLRVAFSRDDSKYVQHLLEEDKDWLLDELKADSSTLCICGNTKMGQDVMTLIKLWLGEDEVKQRELKKKIIKELWAN